jgi:hypothetical protein
MVRHLRVNMEHLHHSRATVLLLPANMVPPLHSKVTARLLKDNMERPHPSRATALLLLASMELLPHSRAMARLLKDNMEHRHHKVNMAHHPSRVDSVGPLHSRLSVMALNKLPTST